MLPVPDKLLQNALQSLIKYHFPAQHNIPPEPHFDSTACLLPFEQHPDRIPYHTASFFVLRRFHIFLVSLPRQLPQCFWTAALSRPLHTLVLHSHGSDPILPEFAFSPLPHYNFLPSLWSFVLKQTPRIQCDQNTRHLAVPGNPSYTKWYLRAVALSFHLRSRSPFL